MLFRSETAGKTWTKYGETDKVRGTIETAGKTWTKYGETDKVKGSIETAGKTWTKYGETDKVRGSINKAKTSRGLLDDAILAKGVADGKAKNADTAYKKTYSNYEQAMKDAAAYIASIGEKSKIYADLIAAAKKEATNIETLEGKISALQKVIDALNLKLQNIKDAKALEKLREELNLSEKELSEAEKALEEVRKIKDGLDGKLKQIRDAAGKKKSFIAEEEQRKAEEERRRAEEEARRSDDSDSDSDSSSSEGSYSGTETGTVVGTVASLTTPVAPGADSAVAGARTGAGTGRRAAATTPATRGVLGVRTPADDDADAADAANEAADEAIKNVVADADTTETSDGENAAPQNSNESGTKISDPETPLAANPYEENDQMNWLWLLAVAALGGTGVAMYEKHKKKVMANEEMKKYKK